MVSCSVRPAPAANYTWTGGGADAFWNTGANWLGGIAPDYSLLPTSLQFSGTARTNAINRTPSPLVAFIDFTNDNSAGRSAAFTLSGSTVLLDPQSRITTAGLASTGTITDTIALPLLLNGGVTFALGGSTGAVHNLAVTGGISGSGTLVATGSYGTLTLAGSNSYIGNTWVRGGTLLVPTGGVLSGSSAIRVGVSPGENAMFRVDGGLVVSSTAWIAYGEPGVGTATVSSGTWINTGWFDVGRTGTGTLNIFGTGVVNVGSGTGTITLAPATNARSTLNLGDGVSAGTLQAALVGGTSAVGATVNFNHASSQYVFAPQIAGNISVTHVGLGRTILTGSNWYTGPATIQAGTLQFATEAALPLVTGTPANRFTVASGATLALNVGGTGEFTTSAIDSLKGLGTGTSGFLNGSYLGFDTTNAVGGTFAYASSIANTNSGSNALGLRKLGTGGLTLSGNNNFTGGVVVEQGTLTAASPYALGTGTAQVRGGVLVVGTPIVQPGLAGVVMAGGTISGTAPVLSRSTFDVRSGVVAASLTGTVGLTKTTPGTVILSASNSYTGPTIVQEGTLQAVGQNSLLGSPTVPSITTGSGATLALNVGGTGEFTALAIDYLKDLGTGTSGFLNGSYLGFDTTNAIGGTFAYASAIANPNGGTNALGVTKLGTGGLTLAGYNTFTGGVIVQSGTLTAASPYALGTGTIEVRGGVLAVESPIFFRLNGLVLAGGTITGTTSLSSLSTYDLRSGIATVSLQGNGVNKTTSGTVILTGGNSFNGTVLVQEGTLQFGSIAAFEAPAFTTGTGATLALNVGGTGEFTASVIDNLKGLGTGTSGFLNGSYLGFDTTNAVGGTFAYASSIANTNSGSNALGLRKLGTGGLTLSGNNSFTGGVIVQSGTLTAGSVSALGTGTTEVRGGVLVVGPSTSNFGLAGVVLAGGTISGSGQLASRTAFDMRSGVVTASLTGTVGLTKTTPGTVILSASNSYTGPTVVQEGTLHLGRLASLMVPNVTTGSGATLALNVGGTGEFTTQSIDSLKGLGTGTSGFLNGSYLGFDTTNAVGGTFAYASSIANTNSGSNALGLRKLGTGGLTLSGNNSFTGGVVVEQGTLTAGSVSALGTGTTEVRGGVLVVGASTSNFGLAGVVLAGGTISGSGQLASRTPFDMRSGVVAASLTGTVGLTKTTPGTVILSASNSYTGPTVVQEGTLQAVGQNSLLGSPTVPSITTGSGATLALNVGGTGEFTALAIDYLKGLGTGTSGFLNGSYLGFDTTNAVGGTFAYASNITNPNKGTNALGVTKLGTGGLTLAGYNTFTGGVIVQSGTLTAASPYALGTGTAQVRGGVLVVSAPIVQSGQLSLGGLVLAGGTISGTAPLASRTAFDMRSGVVTAPLTGTVGLTKTTPGTVILSASNSYTGPTVVQEGTLQAVGQNSLLGSPTVPSITTGSGATLALNVGGTGEFTALAIDYLKGLGTGTSGFLNGSYLGFDTTNAVGGTFAYASSIANTNSGSNALGLRKLGTGGLTLSGNNSFTGGVVVEQGTLTAGSVSALGTGTTEVRGGMLVVRASTSNFGLAGVVLAGGTISGSGQLASRTPFDMRSGVVAASLTGTVGLTKTTPGTVILSASNSYTGPTVVQEGTLHLGRLASLMVPNVTTGSGATLALNVGGTGEFTALAIDYLKDLGTGTSGFLNGSYLGFDTTNAVGGTFAYASSITNPNGGANALGIAKLGAGTLVLAGVNSYTGGTNLSGGVLTLEHASALGSSGQISFSGGTLQYSASNTTDYSGRFSTAAGQAYSIDTNGQNVKFATVLNSVGGTLNKLGAGTLTLSGTSSLGTVALDMTTNVMAGTLTGLSSGTSLLVLGFSGTGTLNLNGGNVNAVTSSLGGGYFGGVAGSVGIANVSSGTWTNSNTIVIGNRGIGTLNVNGGSVTSLFGELGVSDGSLGTVMVSSGTWFNSRELWVGRSGTGRLTLTGGLVTVGGTLSTGNFGMISLNAGGTLQIGTGSATGVLGVSTLANNGTLIFNRSNASTFSGAISGSGALMQVGVGTLTLSGSNSFSGNTTVVQGRLALAQGGSIAASPLVTIAAGATLDVTAKPVGYVVPATQTLSGNGTVDGSATLGAGATLSPGASPGTLTITQGLTWAGGGNYNWQIYDAKGTAGSATGWDLVSVGGALDMAATSGNKFNINLWSLSSVTPDANGDAVNFSATTSGTWRIATATGGITNFSPDRFAINLSANNGAGGLTNNLSGGTFSLVQQGNDVNLVFTPGLNPTPATLIWYGDGVNPGGGGAWTTTGTTWFDGTTMRPWVPSAKAIFTGSAGAVTLGSDISASGGLHFASTGYTLSGVGLTLDGTSTAVDVATGVTATVSAPLSGTVGLAKTGAGTLSLAAANTYTGVTLVQSGTMLLANGAATANSAVTVQSGAAVKIDPAVTMKAPSLTLAGGRLDGTGATVLVNGTAGIGQLAITSGTVSGRPSLTVSGSGLVSLPTDVRHVMDLTALAIDQVSGGKLDIGKGRINIAAGGITEADLRADIVSGRGTGAFSGTSGIVTSGGKASATSSNPVVGYRVFTTGSAAVAWAAFGDANLDGQVNLADISLINSSQMFNTSSNAVWAQGDFNYSNRVNTTDISLLNSSALYNKGSYLPSTSQAASFMLEFGDGGGIGGLSQMSDSLVTVSVPEPSTMILAIAGLAGAAAAKHRRSTRRRCLPDANRSVRPGRLA